MILVEVDGKCQFVGDTTNLIYRIPQQQNTHSSQVHTEWYISTKTNKKREREDISKSDKPLAKPIRKKRVETQITVSRMREAVLLQILQLLKG